MTLDMLKASHDAGVCAVIATPHFLPWQKNVSTDTVRALCAEAMQRCCKELGFDMRILPGNELFYHIEILKDLAEGRACTLAGSRYVLVEFAEDAPLSEILGAAERFRRSPWRLIAAHAERYTALRSKDTLEKFLDTGAELQSNIAEMQGGFFDSNKNWLKKRYAAQEIRYVASDMHNMSQRPPISAASLRWFGKNLDEEYRDRLFHGNPEKILRSAEARKAQNSVNESQV